MAIMLDHTIVPAHDKEASARFFARIFGLRYEGPVSHFAPVRINDGLTLDFDDRDRFGVLVPLVVKDDRPADLLMESAVLCLSGIVAGVIISYTVRAAFLAGFPTLSILITPGWIMRAGAIALAGALFGASYPAWMASRKDAVEALSYD